jgi:hypothetical protein
MQCNITKTGGGFLQTALIHHQKKEKLVGPCKQG